MKLVGVLFVVSVIIAQGRADKPCAARKISGQSTVCVCTPEYCDEITRNNIDIGEYVMYSSTKEGLRFDKQYGHLAKQEHCPHCESVLDVNVQSQYQFIEGFGGAVTDAAGINWKNLSRSLQELFIESYFGDKGLQYNMLRVPIGGSDFSTYPYTYNELPENDVGLSNFSLSYEDYAYKLPMIKAIMKKSSNTVHIVATTWSPPVWMKSNHKITGIGHLLDKFYQTYALYHLKFLQKYDEQGVPVWAITTTNEPVNGLATIVKFNSLGWLPSKLGKFVAENLGPTLRNSKFSGVKILLSDDQRYSLPFYFSKVVRDRPEVLNYVAGAAVHYYADAFTPAGLLSQIPEEFPGKFVLATEACEGSFPWDKEKVILGSWDRAENYMHDILEDLNHRVVGWIDWNLCLNSQGGPNWANNFVDSPIIVFPEKNEFIKQPMFYAMGHFSKFIPRGSTRVHVTETTKSILQRSIEHAAFLTPTGSVVAVLYNKGNAKTVQIKLAQQQITVKLDEHSFNTIEIPFY